MTMKTSIRLALDLSFTGAGVFAVSDAEIPASFPKRTPNGKMGFARLSVDESVRGGFEGVLYATLKQDEQLNRLVHGCTVSVCIAETPPPFGAFAAGLYGLDTFILNRDYLGSRRYLIPPSAINGFFGVKKPKKSLISAFVMRQLGAQAIRLNHDEASAYLLLYLWSLRMKGISNRPTIYHYDGKTKPTKLEV